MSQEEDDDDDDDDDGAGHDDNNDDEDENDVGAADQAEIFTAHFAVTFARYGFVITCSNICFFFFVSFC